MQLELLLVGALALVMEIVDSGLGMMYGTILSPLLILLGFDPKMVVPLILLSQALGGASGSLVHHKKGNVNFRGLTRDTKIGLSIIVPGLLACIVGVFVGKIVPPTYMKLYIGVLVIAMGVLCLRPIYYTFSWRRMWGIGLLAGFNKAFSGGGFGPVTSAGKILGGVDPKVSVGTTTLSEIPICLTSFLVWFLVGGTLELGLSLAMCSGALIGGLIGPLVTSKLNTRILKIAVGILALVSGLWLVVDLII